ncbi:MAG: 50S ribosomal protein L21 [Solirubrobacterales bacterium]
MDTYAVIESGGKQYKVEEGTALLVDRLPEKEGSKVSLRAVMFRDEQVVADPSSLQKVKVEATVAEHLRGPKVKVFKYKAKKGYRRRAGHRSELTKLEVTEVRMLTRKPAGKAEAKPKAGTASAAKAKPRAKPKPAAKPAADAKPAAKAGSASKAEPAEAKTKAEVSGAEVKTGAAGKPAPKAPAKKPAARKPTGKKPAEKKPAAKKPAARKPAAKKPAAKQEDSDGS